MKSNFSPRFTSEYLISQQEITSAEVTTSFQKVPLPQALASKKHQFAVEQDLNSTSLRLSVYHS